LILAASNFYPVHYAHARLNTVTGGITVGYDFDTTSYQNFSVDNDEQVIPTVDDRLEQYSFAPFIVLSTTGSVDNLTIRVNPSFVYDQESGDQDIDHNFLISAYRDFTRRLRVDFSENFIYSDDPVLLEQQNVSDYNQGRRRYWTNSLNLSSAYSYGTASSIGVGYHFNVLRNEDTGPGGYEDYDRHTAGLSLEHQFTAAWNVVVTCEFTRGLFDPPDSDVVADVGDSLGQIIPGFADTLAAQNLSNDLTEYLTEARVNWQYSIRKNFFVDYSLIISDYDDILRYDTDLHELTAGLQYQYTRRMLFEMGGGPSLETSDIFDSRWGYNAHLAATYQVARNSQLVASVTKGYDQLNFSANNNRLGRDQGTSAYWQAELNLTRQFSTDIAGILFATYRDEDQENILEGITNTVGDDLLAIDGEEFRDNSVFNRKIYDVGGSLSYSFWDWFTAAIRYSFRKHDSELANDSYDEHRIYLTLTVEKELLRW
jgi:hypothetical protein